MKKPTLEAWMMLYDKINNGISEMNSTIRTSPASVFSQDAISFYNQKVNLRNRVRDRIIQKYGESE